MSTNDTCQNCRHWARDDEHPHLGHCNHEMMQYDYEGNVAQDNGVSYFDYEGYSASHRTGQNFGCIHHEAKP